MTGLLIFAAVVAATGAMFFGASGGTLEGGDKFGAYIMAVIGLALLAVALWLAYAAGGA